MALHGYFGNTGAGKTYGTVEYVVIPSLKEGRHVITNIPLDGPLLTSIYGGEVTQLPPDWFESPTFAESIPPGAVLLLDEVWRKWPAGMKVSQVPVVEMALLKEHRHRVDSKGNAMRVVLISQFASDLASWTRKLIAVSFMMEKLDALGSSNRFRVDIYKGCPTGENPPAKLLIRQTLGTYKPEIYQYYRSATQSDTGTVGDETVSDKRGNIWKSPLLILSLVVGVSFPILGVWGVVRFFTQYSDEDAVVEPVEQVAPAALVNPPPPGMDLSPAPSPPPSPEPPLPPAPPGTAISQFWRIGGYVNVGPLGPDRKTAWNSIEGYGRQEDQPPRPPRPGVVLVGPGVTRIIPITDCTFYPGDIDLSCVVDGERVTPWSGQTNATNILPQAVSRPVNSTDRGAERSGAPRSAESPAAIGTAKAQVTVVEDTSRLPRTLQGSR